MVLCSKWYEVMPGKSDEVMPELKGLIGEKKIQGEWPAAHDDWGKCANKLETVLLVAIPSEKAHAPTQPHACTHAQIRTREYSCEPTLIARMHLRAHAHANVHARTPKYTHARTHVHRARA